MFPDGLPNGNGDVHASDSEHSQEESDDDGAAWEQVGPKNKSVVTHSNADKYTTPISEIFGGLLRSSLSTGSSSKESTVLEPFFTVPLNVQVCHVITKSHLMVGDVFIQGRIWKTMQLDDIFYLH